MGSSLAGPTTSHFLATAAVLRDIIIEFNFERKNFELLSVLGIYQALALALAVILYKMIKLESNARYNTLLIVMMMIWTPLSAFSIIVMVGLSSI
ncbi:MAG: hypothetical protein JKY71_03655 [Alphaproteobacteria bacterium]|nr:hypothetical protein [Alphaproteobacteria bacterium]